MGPNIPLCFSYVVFSYLPVEMQDNVMIEWQQWQSWWSVTDCNSRAVGRPSCKSGQEAGCCLIAKVGSRPSCRSGEVVGC